MYKSQNINDYYKKKSRPKKLIEKYNQLRYDSIIDRIAINLRYRARPYLIQFNLIHRNILGCSNKELENHLSSKFVENMTFENYGEWEVDHIKPLASFDLTIETNVRECFHYLNLQPLWLSENRSKGSSIT